MFKYERKIIFQNYKKYSFVSFITRGNILAEPLKFARGTQFETHSINV